MKKTTILTVLIFLFAFQVGVFAENLTNQLSFEKAVIPTNVILANVKHDADLNGKVESWKKLNEPVINPEPSVVLDTGDIVHMVPAPASRCQGLTFDGNSLWVSDYQTDVIYEISPVDGTVLSSITGTWDYVEGLAWDGTYLWAADNGGGGNSGDMVYKIDPSSGVSVDSFQAPNYWAHGITWDGQYLWMNDFDEKTLDKVDPASGQIISQLNAPGNHSIGLTWDGEYLWANNFDTDSLYRIDPVSGAIVAQVVSPHTNPRDMAWDGQYVWVLSWLAATIYQVDVGAQQTSADENVEIPAKFYLSQNYPNPFNSSTSIEYSLPIAGRVKIDIYDLLGRQVKTLLNAEKQAGQLQVVWDASDYSSGVYFYRIVAGYFAETKKMILLK